MKFNFHLRNFTFGSQKKGKRQGDPGPGWPPAIEEPPSYQSGRQEDRYFLRIARIPRFIAAMAYLWTMQSIAMCFRSL
jgi:hypothetical protein